MRGGGNIFAVVPRAGIEPARMISPQDFKSCASTYFAIEAAILKNANVCAV